MVRVSVGTATGVPGVRCLRIRVLSTRARTVGSVSVKMELRHGMSLVCIDTASSDLNHAEHCLLPMLVTAVEL